jgi:hypothetical protein
MLLFSSFISIFVSVSKVSIFEREFFKYIVILPYGFISEPHLLLERSFLKSSHLKRQKSLFIKIKKYY